MLPTAWVIDNYRRDRGELVAKDEDRYNTKYEFDDNEDGIVDHDHEIELPTYALRYEHKVHSGVIWLRNIPLAKKLRAKELRVLMQSYIDEISGTSYETIRLADRRIVVERQAPTVAMVIEEGPAMVAGLPAYAATLEIAKVDEVKVAPAARTRRVQLVLMRAPKDEELKYRVNDIADKESTTSYPVVVLAGYSNMPADFPAGLEEFHDLLRRVSIAGKRGLTLETAPTVQPPQASPGPPPAPKAPASVATPPAATP